MTTIIINLKLFTIIATTTYEFGYLYAMALILLLISFNNIFLCSTFNSIYGCNYNDIFTSSTDSRIRPQQQQHDSICVFIFWISNCVCTCRRLQNCKVPALSPCYHTREIHRRTKLCLFSLNHILIQKL